MSRVVKEMCKDRMTSQPIDNLYTECGWLPRQQQKLKFMFKVHQSQVPSYLLRGTRNLLITKALLLHVHTIKTIWILIIEFNFGHITATKLILPKEKNSSVELPEAIFFK